MRLYELFYIVEGYREAQAEFTQAANNDEQGIKDLIAAYKELVNKNQVQGAERNIDYWRKQGFPAFKNFVVSKQAVPTDTQVKRQKLPGKAINLVDNDQWLIVVPLDKDASCFHGKKSDWCTTKPFQEYFEDYFYDREVTLIYCLNQRTGGMWAIAAHKKLNNIEMFDQQDRSLNEAQFKHQTGLNARELADKALGDTHQPKIAASREEYDTALKKLDEMWERADFSEPVPEIEQLLSKTKKPELCAKYINARYISSNQKARTFSNRVTVPKAILMTAAVDNEDIIKKVDTSMLTDSTVLQLYKRNKGILHYLEGVNISPALIHELLKDNPENIYQLLKQSIPVPENELLKLINNEYKQSASQTDYTAKPKGIGRTLVPTIIENLVRTNTPISKKVIQAAIRENGTVISYLMDAKYELDDNELLDAVKSNANAIGYIAEYGRDTPELQIAAINSSKAEPYIFNIICTHSRKVFDGVVDAAIALNPIESFSVLANNDIPISEAQVNKIIDSASTNKSKLDKRRIDALLEYVTVEHKEYLSSSMIDKLMDIDAEETGLALLNASHSYGDPIALSHELLVKIASTSKANAAEILRQYDTGESIPEDLQVAFAKYPVTFDRLLKKNPDISRAVMLSATKHNSGHTVVNLLVNEGREKEIDDELISAALDNSSFNLESYFVTLLNNQIIPSNKIILQLMNKARDPLHILQFALNAGIVPSDEMMLACNRTSSDGIISAIEIYIDRSKYLVNILGKKMPPLSERVITAAMTSSPYEMEDIAKENNIELSDRAQKHLQIAKADYDKQQEAYEEELEKKREDFRNMF